SNPYALKEGSGEMSAWTSAGLQPSGGYYPYDPTLAAYGAEQAKRRKYENLDSRFIFVPFGVETLGPWSPEARALFKELSKRVIESTGDPKAGS
ncbi:jg10293, partial [Pararge aegeria aegeria]